MLGGGGNQTKTLPKKSRYKAPSPPPPQNSGGKRPKAVRTVPAQFPPPGPSLAPLCLHPSPLPWHPSKEASKRGCSWWHGDIPATVPSSITCLEVRELGQLLIPCFQATFFYLGAIPVWLLLGLASLPSVLPHIPLWCLCLAPLDTILRPAMCTGAIDFGFSWHTCS